MSALLPQLVEEIPYQFLVVAEGMGDARLACELLAREGIQNCNVGCPSISGGHGSGVDAVGKYLKSVQVLQTTGKANVKGVLVTVDSDTDPDARFKEMAVALSKAGFRPPNSPFRIEGEGVRTGVFLLPGRGKTGTLEHLLLEAILKKGPKLQQCLDKLDECTGGHTRSASQNQRAKMELSALIACFCRENPFASSGLVWRDRGNPVPIESDCFNEFAEILKELTS